MNLFLKLRAKSPRNTSNPVPTSIRKGFNQGIENTSTDIYYKEVPLYNSNFKSKCRFFLIFNFIIIIINLGEFCYKVNLRIMYYTEADR